MRPRAALKGAYIMDIEEMYSKEYGESEIDLRV